MRVRTGNGVGWQASGGEHNVAEVDGRVVDGTELVRRFLLGHCIEELIRRLYPRQTGKVATHQSVDERVLRLAIRVHFVCKTYAFRLATMYGNQD